MIKVKKYIQINLLAVILMITMIACSQFDKQESTEVIIDGYELVWADEFNYTGLPDSTKWSYDLGDACDLPAGCGWGNHELQYYTDRLENVRVKDGHLTIEVLQEKMGKRDYTSARLVTKGKGDWKYGRFEIKAKLPNSLGTWAAIWMLSTDWEYGGWPHSGEIDIMENVAYDSDTIVGTAHTLDYHHSIGTHKTGRLYVPDSDEEFHVYSLEWEADQYQLFVDDRLLFTFKKEADDFKKWPFDKRFHLILNVAYGGDWGGKMGVDPKLLPAKMEVDYVRVYQKEKEDPLKNISSSSK